ncbi:MAG: hypothetical protein ACOCUO_01015 [archaeon]
MILGAWQVLVLVGTGAAYHGLVKKGEGAVFALLGTVGCFAVGAIGALSLETDWTTSTEMGIVVLLALTATIAAIALPVAITKSGPYAPDDVEEDDGREAFAESENSAFDRFVARMT